MILLTIVILLTTFHADWVEGAIYIFVQAHNNTPLVYVLIAP
jgi:ABC-type amino acid transport system permease subunit